MKKSPTPERLASAERVRSLRASLGLTFEALARVAGVSVAAVRHENGAAVDSGNGNGENRTSAAPDDAPAASGIVPQPEAPAPRNGAPKTTLRFFLHESADADAGYVLQHVQVPELHGDLDASNLRDSA